MSSARRVVARAPNDADERPGFRERANDKAVTTLAGKAKAGGNLFDRDLGFLFGGCLECVWLLAQGAQTNLEIASCVGGFEGSDGESAWYHYASV